MAVIDGFSQANQLQPLPINRQPVQPSQEADGAQRTARQADAEASRAQAEAAGARQDAVAETRKPAPPPPETGRGQRVDVFA
ncbi:MAG TPA: hypothetical protein VEH84_06320 [Alphaproteobacteria bacterium]|nr:hypothetical protein [Alphaproteobacteria bacterium]